MCVCVCVCVCGQGREEDQCCDVNVMNTVLRCSHTNAKVVFCLSVCMCVCGVNCSLVCMQLLALLLSFTKDILL